MGTDAIQWGHFAAPSESARGAGMVTLVFLLLLWLVFAQIIGV